MSILEEEAISLLVEQNPELTGKKIGLVFADLPRNNMRPFLCESLSLRAGKYNFILVNTDYPSDSNSELKIIKDANDTHEISGFIIWATSNFDQYAGRYLEEQNIPFILVSHVSDIFQGRYNEVCTPLDATSLAIEHLVQEGAKKIGFVLGEKMNDTVYVQQRYMCYRNILLENNLNVYEPIAIPDYRDPHENTRTDQEIANEIKKFDAVFTATDFLMGLLYKRCFDANIRVPDDLLIASIDNTVLSECLDITSLEQNFPKIAATAIDLLASIFLNPEQEHKQYIVQSELVIRSSSQRK